MHVNGESAVGKSYSAVVNMVKRSREVLQLIVVAQEDDILQSVGRWHFASQIFHCFKMTFVLYVF